MDMSYLQTVDVFVRTVKQKHTQSATAGKFMLTALVTNGRVLQTSKVWFSIFSWMS